MKTILIVSLMVITSTTWTGDSQYLTYDDFIKQVEAGNVKSVTFDKYTSMSGTIADGNTIKTFRTFSETGSGNDPLLNHLLKEHNVQITVTNEKESFLPDSILFVGCIMWVIPVVFLVLLIIIIVKLNRIIKNQKNNQPKNGVNVP